jgi:hypothetical protein
MIAERNLDMSSMVGGTVNAEADGASVLVVAVGRPYSRM